MIKELIIIIVSYILIMFSISYMLIYSFNAELEHQELKQEAYQNYIIKNQNK